jgi:hypothetical protein
MVAAGGSRGGRLVAADLLVFIRMLIYLTAYFGCATEKLGACRKIRKKITLVSK